MPLYEWQCANCGETISEFSHKIICPTERNVPCPQCGGAMHYVYGCPMAVTNPAWLGPRGTPSHPGERWYNNWQEQDKKRQKRSGLDLYRERIEREAGESEINRRGKKPFVG